MLVSSDKVRLRGEDVGPQRHGHAARRLDDDDGPFALLPKPGNGDGQSSLTRRMELRLHVHSGRVVDEADIHRVGQAVTREDDHAARTLLGRFDRRNPRRRRHASLALAGAAGQFDRATHSRHRALGCGRI